MVTKAGVLLFVVATVTFSQTLVSLSGTVFDSYSNKPVSGAVVLLAGNKLSASTDTNGFFTISSNFDNTLKPARRSPGPEARGTRDLLFSSECAGNTEIRVYALSGRQAPMVFTRKTDAGVWRFIPPRLAPGVYVCRITTPTKPYVKLFLSQDDGGAENHPGMIRAGEIADETNPIVPARKSADPSVVDSLQVTKKGYFQTVVPVDNLFKDGLKIYMTDTSAPRATIVPDSSWACGMPGGIPSPAAGDLVFRATLQISATRNVGITQYGHRRFHIVKGGAVTGTRIQATVLSGGLEFELKLSNGSVELEQIHVLRASDNTLILMRNAGVAPAGDTVVRVVPDFEAPNSSSFAWLNTGKFAATRVVNAAVGTIILDVYDVSKVALADPRIQIRDPEGVPDRSWVCVTGTGTKGASVFTESVTLGASLTIGASKRGSRNIIPITGGTTTGRVAGSILAAGGDYQLSGFDARYVLAPGDGEFIIVRNCGPLGALVPQFEARTDGPYVFLNVGNYLSSDPVSAGSGVSITFSERQ
jgi:hypothetical protein